MAGKMTKKDRKYLEEFAADYIPIVETIERNNIRELGGPLGQKIKLTKPKKVDLSRINLKAMYDNNRTYGGDRYIDTTMLRTIDNYLINNNVHLPQRQAIAYTVQQEGNTTKDHGNGAAGLTGWRGNRAVGLPKTLQGQMNKLYTELYGPFNGDNWNHGGKGSGYNSAREAQEAFKNAITLEDALRALNYGYVRPPREDILYRIQNGSKAFTKTKRLGGSNRYSFKNGGIYIKPENRGKFNATKARTGKTTEELTHSKNPITRKRAIFAQNAAKWNKK